MGPVVTSWQLVAVLVTGLLCTTILGVAEVLPGEAVAGLVGTVLGGGAGAAVPKRR